MKYLFLLVLVFVLNGCGQGSGSKKSAEANALEQGFEMLDEGRFEDAIQYFERVYQSKPSDDALKAWASAYVARAGLKVSSLYEAFTTFPSEKKVTQDNILVQIQAYKNSLDNLPYVKGTDRADLQTATSILQMHSTSSVRLFRAILNLVLLRSTFSDGDKVLLNAHTKVDLNSDLKLVCKLEWRKLRSWLQIWPAYGLELKQDLDFAFPAKKKQWSEGEKFFKDARNFSTTIAKECN